MRPLLQLKLGQQLTMTPQLQQAIKLLQLSSLELELEIQNLLGTNLLLEEAEPTVERMELSPQSSYALNFKKTNTDPLLTKISETTLKQHLYWQMELAHFSEQDKTIATALIDAISEEGYLLCDLNEIQENLEINTTPSHIEKVLNQIQQFEPTGVGARNLSECLNIQLSNLPSSLPWITEAKTLVSSYLNALGQKNYKFLKSKLNLSDQALKETIKILTSLDPRPGTKIFSRKSEYITPDVIVSKKDRNILVSLNAEIIPNICLNAECLSLIKNSKNKEHVNMFKEQLKEAKFFLKGIETRNNTLLRVSQCIMEQQIDFLEQGESALKPLNLQDVANILNLHESTISRITTKKYILTPRGIFELKYFFPNALSADKGQETSTTSIRAMIRKIIAKESSQTPLSDHKIKELLREQGISIARRTVTKYREAMRIPSSHERKNLSVNLK